MAVEVRRLSHMFYPSRPPLFTESLVEPGFVRHDGPYAAASTTRNQGTRAPIDAFDPSAFSLAAPKPARQHSSNISPRAAATLAAMDSEGFSNDGPYGAAMGNSGSPRRHGDDGGDVSMGFPSKKASGKGQQLIEIYGVRSVPCFSRAALL